MSDRRRPRSRTRGFTLVELLVVLTIILLVSAATLPTVIAALSHREVSESARILQAALVGAHDAAIRANEPRGIRLLPDPALTQPPFSVAAGAGVPGTLSLAYNRFVPIQPAPQYNDGLVAVRAFNDLTHPIVPSNAFPPPYPHGGIYPYPFLQNPTNAATRERADGRRVSLLQRLRPHPGDQLAHVVVLEHPGRRPGPAPGCRGLLYGRRADDAWPCEHAGEPRDVCQRYPPGTLSPLTRFYPSLGGAGQPIEYLFLVNGIDNNNNGLVDEGWNNLDD